MRKLALGLAAVLTLGTVATTPTLAHAAANCTAPTQLTLLSFNDFHGRLAAASPDTVQFVGTIEKARAAAGATSSLLLSAGDSLGATLFASMAQNDEPTIELLNAMGVDASAIGNHELDQGWSDFAGRIQPGVAFPYLAANLYLKGTTTPATQTYAVFERSGLRVGVIGAITGSLPGLVGPTGIANLDVGDPVAAVNKVIAQLKDGNTANGEADVIVVAYHEGAPGSDSLANQVAASPAFANLVTNTDSRAQVIFNGHTHMTYAWDSNGRPIVQAGSYASGVGQVVLGLDPTSGATCSATASVLDPTKVGMSDAALMAAYPRAAAADSIVKDAIAQAATIGQRVIGSATATITRPFAGSTDRSRESSLSNMVAQMFYDTLAKGDPNFIGLQNPGGTRADLPAGPITYAQAAAVLPFANSLMTTQITGAQLKTVLEQQWQYCLDKTTQTMVPCTRPYLQLGMSKNLTYTYDESLPLGSRITSITVSGQPVDPAGMYTIGSGSFFITGGDQFYELAKGTNTTDTGRADLESWVEWLTTYSPLTPSFAKQAVSVHTLPTVIRPGVPVTFTVGAPQGTTPLAKDTLDMVSTGAVANTSLVATLSGFRGSSGATAGVGTATVTSGIGTITVTLDTHGAQPGPAVLTITAPDSGTVITIPVTIVKNPNK